MPSYRLERVHGRRLFRLAFCARINAGGELATGFLAPVTRLSQGYLGIGAERQHLLNALEPVAEPPPLAPVGLDEKPQSVCVRELIGAVSGSSQRDTGVG